MAPLKPLVNFKFKHFLYNKVMNPMLPLVVTLFLPNPQPKTINGELSKSANLNKVVIEF
jgi:hypothetical protein